MASNVALSSPIKHVSIVKFCETTFGLPSLNARTTASDGMKDCFDFSQAPG